VHYEVHLACPIFSHDEIEQIENCKAYAKSITTIYINPYIAKARCLFSLFSKKFFTISYFYSKKFKEIIKYQDFDIVLVDCSSMAQYAIDI